MKKTLLRLWWILILAWWIYFWFMKWPSRDAIVFAWNYQAYEIASGSINSDKITVLDFFAPRCPSCRAAHKNIVSEVHQLPANLQILNVDYDTNTDLRQKYGVTSQHTFVLIDKQWNMIKKIQWLNHVAEIINFVWDYTPATTPADNSEVTSSWTDIIIPSTGTGEQIIEKKAWAPTEIITPSAGIYTDYESGKKYISDSSKKVVLFFHASRCPNCRQAEEDILAHKDTIDPNLVILKVDYDNSTELKKKYGITSQTSYVVLNTDGSMNKKMIGLTSLQSIEKFVQ